MFNKANTDLKTHAQDVLVKLAPLHHPEITALVTELQISLKNSAPDENLAALIKKADHLIFEFAMETKNQLEALLPDIT